MELEFNDSLPEFLESPANSKDIEFSSNKEFSHLDIKKEESKGSIKGKISNIQKMMKLATSVSLTATSMGVGAAVIVPIIKPVEKPKPIIIEVEEVIEEEYISEYASLLNGDWYLIGKKVSSITNDEEEIISDESFYSEEPSYSIKLDETDKENPIMYLSYIYEGEEITEPLIKIEDNLFSTSLQKDDGVYKIYVSLENNNLLIKEVSELHSSLSEEGRQDKYIVNYFYYGKDREAIYIPSEIIPEEEIIEEEIEEIIEEPSLEELESGRVDIDENGEKFDPNEEIIEEEVSIDTPNEDLEVDENIEAAPEEDTSNTESEEHME